jgi:acyl dehydratase
MSISPRHILEQRGGLRALGETAVRGVFSQVRRPSAPPTVPSAEVRTTVAPPSRELVEAYLRSLGTDPSAYRDTLPPHLFPQWGFLPMSRTLVGIPYPIMKVVNAGCRLEIRKPLPMGEPLEVRAQLIRVDADERKALMTTRVITGTRSTPEALVADVNTFVPLGRPKKGVGDAPRVTVPDDASELEEWKLPRTAGLEYATLAGDFNPIHWVPQYARVMGFKNVILHGFATMARAMEGLNRQLFQGDAQALQLIEVRFMRPLVLPGTAKLYVKNQSVYVGSAPGKAPFLEGSFVAAAKQ